MTGNKIALIASNILMALKSLFWKKDSSIVLFGAWFGEKFADNSRFLFQHLSENKRKYGLTHVVWVTMNMDVCKELNNMGYEAYMFGTSESKKFHKLAKFHFICNAATRQIRKDECGRERIFAGDIELQYSWRAKRINLWHGVGGVKAMGFESNAYIKKRKKHLILYTVKERLHLKSAFFRKFFYYEGGWGDAFYVATSYAECEKFRRKLLIPFTRLILTGYPRNCPCPRLTEKEENIIRIIQKHKNCVLYLPTFRERNDIFDFHLVGDQIKVFWGCDDILWIQKAHSGNLVDLDYSYDGRILNLKADFDINTITPFVDIVVTDYSGAMLDGQYHYKPIILYTPDYEEYSKGGNGILPEAEEIMNGCGFIYNDITSLAEGIKSLICNPDKGKPKTYEYIRKKYWGNDKDLDQIWEDIISYFGE